MIVKMIGVINSSIRFEDSIRTKKNDSQVPNTIFYCPCPGELYVIYRGHLALHTLIDIIFHCVQ